jgi:chromosome segregation ATPase
MSSKRKRDERSIKRAERRGQGGTTNAFVNEMLESASKTSKVCEGLRANLLTVSEDYVTSLQAHDSLEAEFNSVASDHEVTISDLRAQLLSLSGDYKVAIDVRKSLRVELASVSDVLQVFVTKNGGLHADLEASETECKGLRADLEASATECKGLRADLEASATECKGLRTKLREVDLVTCRKIL